MSKDDVFTHKKISFSCWNKQQRHSVSLIIKMTGCQMSYLEGKDGREALKC